MTDDHSVLSKALVLHLLTPTFLKPKQSCLTVIFDKCFVAVCLKRELVAVNIRTYKATRIGSYSALNLKAFQIHPHNINYKYLDTVFTSCSQENKILSTLQPGLRMTFILVMAEHWNSSTGYTEVKTNILPWHHQCICYEIKVDWTTLQIIRYSLQF